MQQHPSLFPVSDPISVLPGVTLLPKFACSKALAPVISEVCRQAPVRNMVTQRGQTIRVSMTNCGDVGWVSDTKGYRYSRTDPVNGQAWPDMPEQLSSLAQEAAKAAGYDHFIPDACLINRYEPGLQMGAHQDRNEKDYQQPIVSVSLGIPARFFMVGPERTGASTPIDVTDGDVVVFGGEARLHFHGVRKLKPNDDPLWGPYRWNLTFRKAL